MSKTCTCGSVMWRHSKDRIITTGEEKIRFRCPACKRIESYYRKPGSDEWIADQRTPGSHKNEDAIFQWDKTKHEALSNVQALWSGHAPQRRLKQLLSA